MELLTDIINKINGVVWGPLMLLLILGTGLFLQIGLKAIPLKKLATGFRLLWKGRTAKEGEGEISPFNALMTSLSATIGTGNIAGVATAIFLGGPGALFWMWCTALVGMATKYAEAVCAVKYREVDKNGNHVGGPMYYIKNGLGEKWLWLATAFAIFGAIAGFGIGNMVQANAVADALSQPLFGVRNSTTAIVLMVLVGLVLIGGIKRIAHVAGALVPIMAIAYLLAGLVVLGIHITEIPAAVLLVCKSAFTPVAATGGFAGAAVWAAIRFGVARGVFSNEAGLGSAPIAHAAAKTNNPVRQGLIAMLGTFIDTIIVCSITGLAIIVTGVWTSGKTAAPLTSLAFESTLPGVGSIIVTVALTLFAFTTILGWSFYGEKCVEFLFGVRSILPFRILWILAIPLAANPAILQYINIEVESASTSLKFIWLISDTLNAFMAIPNLIALLILSPIVFKLSQEYFSNNTNLSS